jgi:YbbR domain-containing protein
MRWLASNIRTIILALALAVAVWISAVTAADPDEIRSPIAVPLEIIGQNPSLIITSELPSTVEVTLRAPRSVWEQITAQENSIRAVLDISNLEAGEHTADIAIQIAVRPTQLVLSNPASVSLTLERLAARTLPVDLSLSGQPAVGYQAGDPEIDAETVVISGPESLVEQVERARILMSFASTRESIDQAVPVLPLDSQNGLVEGVTVSPETIHLTIPVSQQGGFRDVAVKVVVSGQVAAGYRLENISVFPPVITVFASDPELVNALPGVIETEALDLQDAKENISTRLALTLPENISIVGAQTVQVTVGVSPIQTSVTLLNQPINVTGLGEGLAAHASPQTVDVIISGPLPVLDALTPQDITVNIDVTGLEAGTYQLSPAIEILIENVLVESILPGTIEVVISVPSTGTPSP